MNNGKIGGLDLSYNIYIYDNQTLTPIPQSGGQFNIAKTSTYVLVFNTNSTLTNLTGFMTTSGSTVYSLQVGTIANKDNCYSTCNKTNMTSDVNDPNNCICTEKGYVYNPLNNECIK